MTEDRDVGGYMRLCARVMHINPDAAQYMLCEAPELSSFDYTRSLLDCFTWAQSPQGHEFWERIAIRLGQVPS